MKPATPVISQVLGLDLSSACRFSYVVIIKTGLRFMFYKCWVSFLYPTTVLLAVSMGFLVAR